MWLRLWLGSNPGLKLANAFGVYCLSSKAWMLLDFAASSPLFSHRSVKPCYPGWLAFNCRTHTKSSGWAIK